MKKLIGRTTLIAAILIFVFSASSCGLKEHTYDSSISDITVTATVNEKIPVIESKITGTFETTQPCL